MQGAGSIHHGHRSGWPAGGCGGAVYDSVCGIAGFENVEIAGGRICLCEGPVHVVSDAAVCRRGFLFVVLRGAAGAGISDVSAALDGSAALGIESAESDDETVAGGSAGVGACVID